MQIIAHTKATPDEITYMKKAAAIREEETRKFQHSYQSLIGDYTGSEIVY